MADSDFTDEINYVPALAGFDVLIFRDKTFDALPVVAWAIMHGHEGFVIAWPVTTQPWSINDDRTVRCPSGEVIFADRVWPTVESWLAEMKTNDGVPLEAANVSAPEVALSDRPGTVLALDSFRDRFRGEQ
jgi:hypothetical protein